MKQLMLKDLFTQRLFGYLFPLFILLPIYMSNLARQQLKLCCYLCYLWCYLDDGSILTLAQLHQTDLS